MKHALIVEESNDYVVYGEVNDDIGYSPDAELYRGTLDGARAYCKANDYDGEEAL